MRSSKPCVPRGYRAFPYSAVNHVSQKTKRCSFRCSKRSGGSYCDGKIFGLICDDCFYLKPTEAGKALLRTVELRPPYGGAKDYFLITDVDDRDYLAALVTATCKALPGPKPKIKKKS